MRVCVCPFQDGSLQAQSNLSFLSLLREPCEELAQLNPREVAPKLAHVLNLIRLIWVNSVHYNTRARLTSLFRKVGYPPAAGAASQRIIVWASWHGGS